jgi:hypothetical protein
MVRKHQPQQRGAGRMKDGCDIDEGFGWRFSLSWEKLRLMAVYVQKALVGPFQEWLVLSGRDLHD